LEAGILLASMFLSKRRMKSAAVNSHAVLELNVMTTNRRPEYDLVIRTNKHKERDLLKIKTKTSS
jgi:hypothetical protein